MKAKELHKKLSDIGVRLFNLTIDYDTITIIHSAKSLEDWRIDVTNIKNLSKELFNKPDSEVPNLKIFMLEQLRELGYIEVTDVVSDVYEGETVVKSAFIKDDPSHEEQETGFGHYGWDNLK